MSKRERDQFLVEEMRRHLAVAMDIARDGKTAFVGTQGIRSRYAARDSLALTAEAAKKLSGSFVAVNPGLEIAKLRRVRRDAMHPYDEGAIEDSIDELWEFVAHDAPSLERGLRRAKFKETKD